MIAYLLLRRRDATYNYTLWVSKNLKHESEMIGTKLNLD